MENSRVLQLLPYGEFKVLKVVQLEGPKNSLFTGYLPYLRTFSGDDGYNSHSNDLLDQKILETIQQNLPDSFLRYSIDILWTDQLEESLRALRGGAEKNITIQFNPQITFEHVAFLAGKTYYAYPKEFNVRLLFSEKERQLYLNDYLIVYLPPDGLEDYLKTIEPI